MWLPLLFLLLLLLILWESLTEIPDCEGWDGLFRCIDLNHNYVHWRRSAILAILVALVLIFLLGTISLLSFLLIFLVVFIASYFSANWLDAHLRRGPDFEVEFYLERLRQRGR